MKALGCLVLLATSACIPLPLPRSAELRPEIRVRVADDGDRPIAGAKVLIQRALGQHWLIEADAQGLAHSDGISEWEWVFPLMMHGVPEYYWRLCIAAPGFANVISKWPGMAPSVTLAKGASAGCVPVEENGTCR